MKRAVLLLLLNTAGLCYGQQTQKLDQALSGDAGLPKDNATSIEQRMSKMEDLLNEQREEIAGLRKQLSIQENGRLDKARADEIRQMIKDILSDENFRFYAPG